MKETTPLAAPEKAELLAALAFVIPSDLAVVVGEHPAFFEAIEKILHDRLRGHVERFRSTVFDLFEAQERERPIVVETALSVWEPRR